MSAERNHFGVLTLLLHLNVKFVPIFKKKKTLNMRECGMYLNTFHIKHTMFSQYFNIFTFDNNRHLVKGEILYFLYLSRKWRNLKSIALDCYV